ncbi:hypothetical protein ISCGN_010906 [Ixodes scapularis]
MGLAISDVQEVDTGTGVDGGELDGRARTSRDFMSLREPLGFMGGRCCCCRSGHVAASESGVGGGGWRRRQTMPTCLSLAVPLTAMQQGACSKLVRPTQTDLSRSA